MPIVEKLPPYDIASEEAVLASLLVDSDMMDDVHIILNQGDFFSEQHKLIYEACELVYKRGENIDQISIARQLANINILELCGGASYLSHLVVNLPTSLHAADYARAVKNLSICRKVIQFGNKVQAQGYIENDPTKLISDVEKGILELQKEVSLPKLITPDELAKRGVERYSELRVGKRRGVYTGFSKLDEALGGLFGGELSYWAARPGMGKTEIILSMAKYVGRNFGNAMLVSLEQPWGDILDRFVGRSIEKSPRIIRAGNYSDELFDSIVKEMSNISMSNMYFYDTGGDIEGKGTTTPSIYSIAKHMKLAYGLSAVFVDYLGLLDDESKESDYRRISYISRKLKQMSKDLDVPIICACQLNREAEKRANHRPQLSDLRDSGATEQDADTVLFLYRDDYYEDAKDSININSINTAELIIGKHRQGGEVAGRIVPLLWDASKRCYIDNYSISNKVVPESFI